jgi:hypothetical protein
VAAHDERMVKVLPLGPDVLSRVGADQRAFDPTDVLDSFADVHLD